MIYGFSFDSIRVIPGGIVEDGKEIDSSRIDWIKAQAMEFVNEKENGDGGS